MTAGPDIDEHIELGLSAGKIDVQFLENPTFELLIKPMNQLALPPGSTPSLFQIAAQIEDFIPGKTPFTELMRHVDTLATVLRAAATGCKYISDDDQHNSVATAPADVIPARRSAKLSMSKNNKSSAPKKTSRPPGESSGGTKESKKAEFSLRAPSARSVKLAADFTGWERSPVELKPEQNGTWSVAVELQPGEYMYRFIVDGEWCNDPLSVASVPNPFGTLNSVRNIV